MTISTSCIRCGAEFEASRDEILAGPTWRLCPASRRAQRPGPDRRHQRHGAPGRRTGGESLWRSTAMRSIRLPGISSGTVNARGRGCT